MFVLGRKATTNNSILLAKGDELAKEIWGGWDCVWPSILKLYVLEFLDLVVDEHPAVGDKRGGGFVARPRYRDSGQSLVGVPEAVLRTWVARDHELALVKTEMTMNDANSKRNFRFSQKKIADTGIPDEGVDISPSLLRKLFVQHSMCGSQTREGVVRSCIELDIDGLRFSRHIRLVVLDYQSKRVVNSAGIGNVHCKVGP